MAVERLYEDENYIIVNKPYDMYINSNNRNEKNTVAYHIGAYDSHMSSSSEPLHFVQRLDFSTSGVMCIAKNPVSAALAGRLFETRVTRKYYLAIVRGHIDFDLADITYAVGVDASPDNEHRMAAVVNSTSLVDVPRPSHSRLILLETGYYAGDPVSVVLLKAVTGRRHQLRVHCNAIGHTVLGDYTYSDKKDITPHRMFLHAAKLVLPFQKLIDIQTEEPFFSDPKLLSEWREEDARIEFRYKDDFDTICDIIEDVHTPGFEYKKFVYKK